MRTFSIHARRVMVTIAVAAGVLGLPVTAGGQTLRFHRYKLANGLTVILHEDHSLPLVAVNIWYYVGGKDEPSGRSGFAHLFEHLMFMGTEKVPQGYFDQVMERAGGSNNASTSSDRTNYFASGRRGLLETLLFLEADRMQHIGPAMTQEKLETQRKVVKNERRQNYEIRPYGQLFLDSSLLMYPEGHPYHQPVIGSHEDLENATLQEVKDFFQEFYFPANASLVIAGDFNPEETTGWVEKHFGSLPSREPLRREPPDAVQLKAEIRHTIEDDVTLSASAMVWHSPAFYQPGDADMDVLSVVLGGGKSSRLYRKLVYEKRLAQAVEVFQWSRLYTSQLWVQAFARPGVSQDDLEEAIDAEIEAIRRDGPTESELTRARNRIDTLFWREVQEIGDRADLLNRYQFYLGEPGALAKDRARYEAVTSESVKRWANRVLRPKARLVMRVVPRAKSEAKERAKEPAKNAPPAGEKR